jgi:hypothetical protein
MPLDAIALAVARQLDRTPGAYTSNVKHAVPHTGKALHQLLRPLKQSRVPREVAKANDGRWSFGRH